ncbi:hypothetical protein GYB22_13020 [bacterium]|nr:hypothetical protein [bacterium]
MNRLSRIVQLLWIVIAVVCIVEGSMGLRDHGKEDYTAYLLFLIAVFAIFRFVMLRRKQLKDDKRI